MNYLNHYIKLIRKAERRDIPAGYVELHHVFPVSLYGDNKRLVALTYKEHIVAHHLLYKICIKRYGALHSKTWKMRRALSFMINVAENKPNGYLAVAVATYLKKLNSGELTKTWGKHTEETKRIISEKVRGENHARYNSDKYDWVNYKLKLIILNKSIDELIEYMPGLKRNLLHRVINGKRKSACGWSLVNKDTYSKINKVPRQKGFMPEHCKNLSIAMTGPKHHHYDHTQRTWINENRGIIEYNITSKELMLKYPELLRGGLCSVTCGHKVSYKGWKLAK